MIMGIWCGLPDTFPARFVCVPTKHVFAFFLMFWSVWRTDSRLFCPTETGEVMSQHPEQHGC